MLIIPHILTSGAPLGCITKSFLTHPTSRTEPLQNVGDIWTPAGNDLCSKPLSHNATKSPLNPILIYKTDPTNIYMLPLSNDFCRLLHNMMALPVLFIFRSYTLTIIEQIQVNTTLYISL